MTFGELLVLTFGVCVGLDRKEARNACFPLSMLIESSRRDSSIEECQEVENSDQEFDEVDDPHPIREPSPLVADIIPEGTYCGRITPISHYSLGEEDYWDLEEEDSDIVWVPLPDDSG